MKSNIYSVAELKTPTSSVGEGSKGLMIVLDDSDKNANLATLEGLVKAIQYDIQNDVTIITKSNSPIDINSILKAKTYSTLILLGLTPNDVGYSLIAKKNFFYKMEGMSFLIADSLSDMNADKAKKMAFWKNLQERFL